MGRLEDLEAAQDFMASHEDDLPVCRSLHHAELGRRVGLALMRTSIGAQFQVILEEADGLQDESRAALIQGIVASMELEADPSAAWASVAPEVSKHSLALSQEVSARLIQRRRSVGAIEP